MPKTKKKQKRVWVEVLAALREFAGALERANKTPCRKPKTVKKVRK